MADATILLWDPQHISTAACLVLDVVGGEPHERDRFAVPGQQDCRAGAVVGKPGVEVQGCRPGILVFTEDQQRVEIFLVHERARQIPPPITLGQRERRS